MRLFSRWGHRSNFAAPSSLRVEVCPPSLRHAPESAWNRIMACLADVHHEHTAALRERVGAARSLRELWHLRTEVFRVVSLEHSQFEAELRLTDLNRHFPTRAPRSGFAPLSTY
jgi:hypothetical protein